MRCSRKSLHRTARTTAPSWWHCDSQPQSQTLKNFFALPDCLVGFLIMPLHVTRQKTKCPTHRPQSRRDLPSTFIVVFRCYAVNTLVLMSFMQWVRSWPAAHGLHGAWMGLLLLQTIRRERGRELGLWFVCAALLIYALSHKG